MQHNNFAISEKSDTFAFLNQKVYPSRAHFQTWSTRPLRRCVFAFKLRTTSIRSQTPTGNRNSTPARMAESVDALVSNTSGAIRAGSIPAPGTRNRKSLIFRGLRFFFWFLHHEKFADCRSLAGYRVHFYRKTALGPLFFGGIKSSFAMFMHLVNHRPPSHYVLLAIQSFNW